MGSINWCKPSQNLYEYFTGPSCFMLSGPVSGYCSMLGSGQKNRRRTSQISLLFFWHDRTSPPPRCSRACTSRIGGMPPTSAGPQNAENAGAFLLFE
eukprot:3988707-Pyramimonas_sp.AAC.1